MTRTTRGQSCIPGAVSLRQIGALSAVSVLAVICAVFAFPGDAQAHSPVGCKFAGSNPTIRYKKGLMATAAFWTATTAGAGRWNAVSVPGTFAPTTGTANIYVTEASFVDGSVYAQTSGSCSGGTWTGGSTTFAWNTGGSRPLNATQQRMVATHELGHSYGLDHMFTSSCSGTKSVMVRGSLKWSCGWGTEPWADDINGVNAIY